MVVYLETTFGLSKTLVFDPAVSATSSTSANDV
jgi:hypothetical protein